MPAIIQTYSDFDNIDVNLIGAENETSFLNNEESPLKLAFVKKLKSLLQKEQSQTEKLDTERSLLTGEATPLVDIKVKIPHEIDLECFKDQKLENLG